MEKTDKIMEKLQKLKNDCGMTNQQIADIAGFSPATIQRYLSGTAKDAPAETICKIILAMGGDPKDILGDAAPPPDRSAEIALYERVIESINRRHTSEIEQLHTAYAETLKANERALEDMRASHKDQLLYYRRWVRVLAITIGVLVFIIVTLFMIDITNPSVGWFRKILNSFESTTAAFELMFHGPIIH